MADEALLELTADIVSSHVAHNNVAVSDLPTLIKSVHAALQGLGAPVIEPEAELKPAVSIRSSIKPEHIVSLESGKKMKMLKRYLQTNYGMTPDDYRRKWSLPTDYPMVAPNYAAQRKALAMKIGLGRKPATAVAPAEAATPTPEKTPKALAKTAPKVSTKTAPVQPAETAPKTRAKTMRKASVEAAPNATATAPETLVTATPEAPKAAPAKSRPKKTPA